MRREYDFSKGVRGKYAARYRKGTNLVLLDPDVAKLFPDSDAVNTALRACGEIIRASPREGQPALITRAMPLARHSRLATPIPRSPVWPGCLPR